MCKKGNCTMAGGKFERPARKLHAHDIISLQNRGGVWSYCKDGLSFSVSIVWLQGKIISFTEDKNQVTLQDGSLDLIITNSQGIPGGNSWISEGQYVMVVGEVQEESNGSLSVRAIKMADLSSNPLHMASWKNEVAEIKALLRENPNLCS